MSRRTRAYAALDALYKGIPTLACKGLCTASCEPVGALATPLENQRIAQHFGPGRTDTPPDRCNRLEHGRCTVHAERPMVCRLWGLTPTMETPAGKTVPGPHCPFGCVKAREVAWPEHVAFMEAAQAVRP